MFGRPITVACLSLFFLLGFLGLQVLSEPPRPRMLLYGDSMCSTHCDFWPAMQRVFTTAEVIADGHVGAPTPGLAATFATAAAWTAHPDLVIVIMGANNPAVDATYTAEQTWSDFAKIRDTAQAADVPVFLGTPLEGVQGFTFGKPCDERWRMPFLRHVHDLVVERGGADAIDFDEAIPPEQAPAFFVDCLHPNAEGGQRMATVIHRIVCEQRYRPEFADLCGRPTGILRPAQ